MRRIVGIIMFAVGLVLLLSHVLHLVPGFMWLGISGMLIGAVIFGLSFIPQAAPGADAPAPLTPAERILGVFYEPEPVFKNLKHYPRWLAAFLVLILFSVGYQVAFTQRVTPERIANETVDKFIDSGMFQNSRMSPEQFREIYVRDAQSTASRINSVLIFTVGRLFIFMLILAGLYLLGVLAFGGRMNFWQALSVATYGSMPAWVLSSILSLIILFSKPVEDLDAIKGTRGLARADLGLLFNPAQHPILYVLGSSIGLFAIYGWWVTVSGLRHASEKISKGYAWAIALFLWLLGLIIVMILAALFPKFIA